MDNAEREELIRRLAAEIEQCREDITRLEVSARPVAPDRALGRLTRMESLQDQGISSAALQHNRERLYRLEQSRERIHEPGFGDCAVCRRPIGIERLMALPESTHCVHCAGR